jgi:hypothetical protein
VTIVCPYLFGEATYSCRLIVGPVRSPTQLSEEWIHVDKPHVLSTFLKLTDLWLGPGGYRYPATWCGVEAVE